MCSGCSRLHAHTTLWRTGPVRHKNRYSKVLLDSELCGGRRPKQRGMLCRCVRTFVESMTCRNMCAMFSPPLPCNNFPTKQHCTYLWNDASYTTALVKESWANSNTASLDEHDVECTTRVRVPLTRPVVTARYSGNTSLASTKSPKQCSGPCGSCHMHGGIYTLTTRCGILGP